MKVTSTRGVPPVTPVVPIQPTDSRHRPPADGKVVLKGNPTTHAGAAIPRDKLTFGGPANAALREGLYGPDGKLR